MEVQDFLSKLEEEVENLEVLAITPTLEDYVSEEADIEDLASMLKQKSLPPEEGLAVLKHLSERVDQESAEKIKETFESLYNVPIEYEPPEGGVPLEEFVQEFEDVEAFLKLLLLKYQPRYDRDAREMWASVGREADIINEISEKNDPYIEVLKDMGCQAPEAFAPEVELVFRDEGIEDPRKSKIHQVANLVCSGYVHKGGGSFVNSGGQEFSIELE